MEVLSWKLISGVSVPQGKVADLSKLKYLFKIWILRTCLHQVCCRIRAIVCNVLSSLKVHKVVKHYYLFLASQILPELVFLSLHRSYWFKHAFILFLLVLGNVYCSARSSEFKVLVCPSRCLSLGSSVKEHQICHWDFSTFSFLT